MKIKKITITCTDQKCKDGKIMVHNAYDSNPLAGKEQQCQRCCGKGFLVFYNKTPLAN